MKLIGHLPLPSVTLPRVLIGLIPLVVLGTFYWSSGGRSNGQALVTVEAKSGPFTAKLSEAGELRSLESATISAQKDLQLIYLAPEGAFVKKGDEVVRFDPTRYEAALEEANAALQVSQAELRKAKEDQEAQRQKMLAEIARFEAEVRLAQLDLDNLKRKPFRDELERARMEVTKAKVAFDNADKRRSLLPELVEKGFITKSALEEAELKYFETKATLQANQFEVEKVAKGATPEELEKAQIRLEQAKVALERAQNGMKSQLQSLEAAIEREKANVEKSQSLIEKSESRLKTTVVRSPRDGLVVYAKAGGEKSSDKVQLGIIPFQGQPLIYLPDISSMVADTEVNEIDIGKVTVEGSVEVRLEAYPGAIFHGKILKIGSLAKLRQSRTGNATGIKVFDVTVKIEEKDPRLKPGLTATLDIIVDRQEDVISIPLPAVVSRRGEHLVFVSHGGKIEERKVVLGASNEQSIIVQKGLRPGEQLILGQPPSGPS
jgi:HlyD family secretion protein